MSTILIIFGITGLGTFIWEATPSHLIEPSILSGLHAKKVQVNGMVPLKIGGPMGEQVLRPFLYLP